MDRIKVLVADSQYLFRLGIIEILNSDERFDFVGESANSQELRTMLKSTLPDIVTIDYAQSDSFTVDDIQHIQQNFPETKILVISSDGNSDSIFKAIQNGAISFLTRNCDQEEIISALLSTSKNEKFMCHRVVDIIINKKVDSQEVDCAGVNLTARELEILQLTAKGHSSKEIASMLYLSLHTVYTHRKNIMKKLDLNSASEMILYAISKGLNK